MLGVKGLSTYLSKHKEQVLIGLMFWTFLNFEDFFVLLFEYVGCYALLTINASFSLV